MSKIPLTAETLSKLGDGFAGVVIDAALADIYRDVNDRGSDGKPRKLVVTYTFTPGTNGHCEVDVQTATRLPAYQPPKTVAKLNLAAGSLMFNPDVSNNPDQLTIDVDADE